MTPEQESNWDRHFARAPAATGGERYYNVECAYCGAQLHRSPNQIATNLTKEFFCNIEHMRLHKNKTGAYRKMQDKIIYTRPGKGPALRVNGVVYE